MKRLHCWLIKGFCCYFTFLFQVSSLIYSGLGESEDGAAYLAEHLAHASLPSLPGNLALSTGREHHLVGQNGAALQTSSSGWGSRPASEFFGLVHVTMGYLNLYTLVRATS